MFIKPGTSSDKSPLTCPKTKIFCFISGYPSLKRLFQFQLQIRTLRHTKTVIETTISNKAFYSSISHVKHRAPSNIRKYAVRFAYTSLGIGVVYDAFDEFQTIGSANRFVRSLRIAVRNSLDYTYNLYGLSEESEGYDEV